MTETLLDTPLVGLEDLQRAAFYVFFRGMNNALQEIQSYWQPRDTRFNQVTERNIPPTVLEPIPSDNFHEGHKPSLMNSEPVNYPNLAVFAMRADSLPESDRLDQVDAWSDNLLVEVMVKGTTEEETNRRVQRTAEAAVMCLRRNQTLGGAVQGLTTVPQVVISDLFAVRSPGQSGAYGPRLLWQGAQMQFRIAKYSITPSSGPSAFAEASQDDYSAFIDQG